MEGGRGLFLALLAPLCALCLSLPPLPLRQELPGDDLSLGRLLEAVARREMAGCSLVLAFDASFEASSALQHLLRLRSLKQVVRVTTSDDLRGVGWTSSPCGGYFLLLSDAAAAFLSFADEDQHLWDYAGKYVFVGFSIDELSALTETMKGKKTEHLAGVIKAQRDGDFLVYMNQLISGSGVTLINSWRRRRFSAKKTLFPDKICNLHQAVLNVVTLNLPPYIIYQPLPDGSFFIYGQEVELIRALAEVFNFTINFTKPPPGEMWGEKLPNGSWNGLVGMLGSGEADLGIANKYITSIDGRLEFEHYTAPHKSDTSCYLARMEPPLPRWQSLGLPFQMITWLAILAGLCLTGPVLFILARASTGPGGPDALGRESLSYACVYILGVHFRVSQTLLPRHPSIRVLVTFLWMYAIILTTGYSSNLTAFLTVSRQPPSVETIKELRESRFKVFGMGPFFGIYMGLSVNPDVKALAERYIALTDFDDITQEVLKGEGVLIQGGTFLSFLRDQLTTPSGLPRARLLKECISPHSVAVGLQTYSPLNRKFSQAINWIVESGLATPWRYKTLQLSKKFKKEERTRSGANATTPDEVSSATSATRLIPLGIDHLQGIFLVLIFGCLLSILVFVCEKTCRQDKSF